MRFVLVHVPEPPDEEMMVARQRWGVFHSEADVGHLESQVGVFPLSRTTWLFDTTKNLPRFAQVIHAAQRSGVQVFAFQLDAESALLHAGAFQTRDALVSFLDS